jgi:membrane protein implicated in regulation of membrane protease activity
LEAGANEIAELNNLKNKLQSEEDELKRVKQHLPNKLILIFLEAFKRAYFKIGYFGAGALVLIAIGYFVSKYLVDVPTEFGWLVSYLPFIFAIVASAEILLLVFYLWVKWIDKTYSDLIETAKKEELEINELKKRIKLAEQTVEERVVKKGILPELRLLISMRLTPSYLTILV